MHIIKTGPRSTRMWLRMWFVGSNAWRDGGIFLCDRKQFECLSGAASGRGEVRGVQGPSLVAVAGDARPNRPIIPIADRENIAKKT